MRYRCMPKTGDELSILGYGCMRLPLVEGGGIDEDKAVAQIRYAIEKGVNYCDTAWPYHNGQSELILGRALQDGYRDRVRIATKLPSWLIKSRADMDHFLDRQLNKLQTGQVDYYLLHALNGGSWDRLHQLGVIDFLDRALQDGRIVNVGFSFHGLLGDFKRIVDAYSWIFCQIQYNYLDRQNQAGLEGLQYAAKKDLGIIVMEPLRGGNLGSKEPPPAIEAIWQTAEKRRTPVEWALRWIWNHPEVSVVLSGMNIDEHIAENLAIADQAEPNSLTLKECEIVDQVAAKYKQLMAVNCTGCGYCLPCPEGVMIPAIFEVYNKMHLFGNRQEAQFIYAARTSGILTGGEAGFASACVECGECLEKCPQQIEIPDILEDAVDKLEGPGLEDRLAIIGKMLRAET